MLYLIGGVVLLFGLLLLGRAFVNAEPKQLARFVKWAAIALAAAAIVALAVSGRLSMLLALAAGLFPLLRRLHSAVGGLRGPSAGTTSEVETPYVRVSLNHDTGAMTGTVLRGRFAGMRLDELRRADLLALLRECRTADDEAAGSSRHGSTASNRVARRSARRAVCWGAAVAARWGGCHGRGGVCDIGASARRRRRGDQGCASSADEAAASRSRRDRLFRRQDQPRP